MNSDGRSSSPLPFLQKNKEMSPQFKFEVSIFVAESRVLYMFMGTIILPSETHRIGHHEGKNQPHPSPPFFLFLSNPE